LWASAEAYASALACAFPVVNYMSLSRRSFLFGSALAVLSGCSQTRKRVEERPQSERVARARKRGVDFLLSRQSEDGGWRSDTYGTFKDGTALTPLALNALLAAAPDRQDAIRKAADYLAAMTRPSYGYDFAIYTAALTVSALSHPRCPARHRARDAWLSELKKRQLTEDLGWKPEDREYGGWGYSRDLPRKARPGELGLPLIESNLSATRFALDALTAAGSPAKEALFARALTFIHRCQNWEDDEKKREPASDDGGFFFIYDDPVRNKAGIAGTDRRGRPRYHSYGSVTADGLRCLAHCGVAESDARRQAAAEWLRKHYQPGRHPGDYAEKREMDRMAVFYYFAASASKEPAGSLQIDTAHGKRLLRELLAEDVIGNQRQDGSWINPAHAIREDDPIAATSFALIALG
jgi:hypothetical protein